MTPAAAVDYLVDYQKIDASALPPFDKSGIYPYGSKLYPLQEMGVKITATGKVVYAQSGKRHMLIKRTKKQIRDKRGTAILFKTDGEKVNDAFSTDNLPIDD